MEHGKHNFLSFWTIFCPYNKIKSKSFIVKERVIYNIYQHLSLTEHFFRKHNWSYQDMHAWIIDYCHSNGPEAQENFCMFNLDVIITMGLNLKRTDQLHK